MWHCECEQSIKLKLKVKTNLAPYQVRTFRGAYTYSLHVAWILGKKSFLSSQGQGQSMRCQGQGQGQDLVIQGQGQDLHDVSSRILEAKARPWGQQDWLKHKYITVTGPNDSKVQAWHLPRFSLDRWNPAFCSSCPCVRRPGSSCTWWGLTILRCQTGCTSLVPGLTLVAP